MNKVWILQDDDPYSNICAIWAEKPTVQQICNKMGFELKDAEYLLDNEDFQEWSLKEFNVLQKEA